MTNFKLMTTLTVAALFAAPAAFAQDETPILDTAPDTVETDFNAADLDQDGSLNADEFVTFSVMRAEGGDEAFKDLVLSGEYDAKFAAHDADASGGIDSAEIGGHSEDMVKPDETEMEGEEEAAPDMN